MLQIMLIHKVDFSVHVVRSLKPLNIIVFSYVISVIKINISRNINIRCYCLGNHTYAG